MRYAIIVNSVVDNVTVCEDNDFATQHGWVEAPNHVNIGWLYNAGVFSAPAPNPGPVPVSVLNIQFRKAIRATGKAVQFKNYVLGLTEAEIEEWQYMPEIYRSSQMVDLAATALNVGNAALNNLFRDAAKL